MSTPVTPKGKALFHSTTTAPSRTAGTQASPHYITTRRHSLYGVEDRVIIDPGSRIWKVGFSGEGKPRDVFYASGSNGQSLWNLQRMANATEQEEEDKMLQIKMQSCLRSVFHDSLLTDPKARKVIVVEHPLLPLYIKGIITQTLFENFVPSVSFASSHLLALLAVGRITGMVLDCGHLESIALPIFAARPLYPQLRTTPLAGSRLDSHLRALLLMFGTYIPPPTSLSSIVNVNIPVANRATRVPEDILTDAVVAEIKIRCCFVGEGLNTMHGDGNHSSAHPECFNLDIPPSDSSQSESEFSQTGMENIASSSGGPSSDCSSVSNIHGLNADMVRGESHLQGLSALYTRHSTATDLVLQVTPPLSQQMGTGLGMLMIPGWIRERAAEVLFEGGDVDEYSLAELILEAFLKVPVDLRKTLASSILVSGGTAMLPGFIPRLHAEILRAMAPSITLRRSPSRGSKNQAPKYDRYASLRPLIPYFAILNNPSPSLPLSDRAKANAGKAPAFTPATMAWVGGSLAGSLKTGGVELSRERWDEEDANFHQDNDEAEERTSAIGRSMQSILPDWTRMPLSVGAPIVNISLMAKIPE